MSTTRRHFLAATSAATLAASTQAAPQDSNARIRIGLVGLGGRATAHLRCLLDLAGDNVELAALCDVDADALAARATEGAAPHRAQAGPV